MVQEAERQGLSPTITCNIVNRRFDGNAHQQGLPITLRPRKAFIATLAYSVLNMECKL